MSFEYHSILDFVIVHMRRTADSCYGSQHVMLATIYVITVNSSCDLMKYWLAN